MDAKSWIARVAKVPPATVAKAIGVTPSTLDSQMKSSTGLKPHTVVAIAREYGASPVGALVDLGLISEAEARDASSLRDALLQMSQAEALQSANDDELLTEIGRRFEERRGKKPGDVVRNLPKRSQRVRRVGQSQDEAARED